MIVKGFKKKPNQITNILDKPKYPKSIDTSLPAIERFIKDEITSNKVCSCKHCNYKRHMYRQLQEILKEYKELKKKK